ncbi:MAG: CopG family ribbon-helix-helix protein [Promethearchaeota archaeon]
MSFNISESLKKFINKLVSKNQYDNKSKLIRDALLRLMSTMDISSTIDTYQESFSEFSPKSKNIIGNMIIVAPNDAGIQKKLNRIESFYKDQIVSKNQNFMDNNSIIYMMFNGELSDFQKFVVEINGIEEIKNFRYLIVN